MYKDTLKEIVNRVCPATIKYDGNQYISDGILESIEIMDIIFEIEDALSITIGAQFIIPEYFESLDTLEKLIEDVKKG